jgi:hypothetical protein
MRAAISRVRRLLRRDRANDSGMPLPEDRLRGPGLSSSKLKFVKLASLPWVSSGRGGDRVPMGFMPVPLLAA